MLHAKFHFIVLQEKIFEDFYHIWAWRPSWSCDLDHLYKLSFPLPKEALTFNLALIGHAVSETKMFENNGHIHVFSPGAGAEDTLG